MKLTTRTRRTLLKTALATTALAAPSVAYAAGNDAPSGLTDRYEFAEEAKSATIQLRARDQVPKRRSGDAQRRLGQGDFPRLLGTANVIGAGWIVPAKHYQDVRQEGLRVESPPA